VRELESENSSAMPFRIVFGTIPGSTSILSRVQLTAVIAPEPPWWVARCLEVEVASQGETSEKALENLREALELYFEDTPAPETLAAPIVTTIEIAA
jgi:predicted RNase H-like HicB family nuclease